MGKFTPQVLEFIHEFVIDDIKKVLKCSDDDAKEALHRIVTEPVNQRAGKTVKNHSERARQFNRVKSFIPDPNPPSPPPTKRLKGEYSNQNAWDKYS
jgi:hypothetical protein